MKPTIERQLAAIDSRIARIEVHRGLHEVTRIVDEALTAVCGRTIRQLSDDEIDALEEMARLSPRQSVTYDELRDFFAARKLAG